MQKDNLIAVGAALATCAILIGGISFWLGSAAEPKAETTSRNSESLPRPLTKEALEAYQ